MTVSPPRLWGIAARSNDPENRRLGPARPAIPTARSAPGRRSGGRAAQSPWAAARPTHPWLGNSDGRRRDDPASISWPPAPMEDSRSWLAPRPLRKDLTDSRQDSLAAIKTTTRSTTRHHHRRFAGRRPTPLCSPFFRQSRSAPTGRVGRDGGRLAYNAGRLARLPSVGSPSSPSTTQRHRSSWSVGTTAGRNLRAPRLLYPTSAPSPRPTSAFRQPADVPLGGRQRASLPARAGVNDSRSRPPGTDLRRPRLGSATPDPTPAANRSSTRSQRLPRSTASAYSPRGRPSAIWTGRRRGRKA